MVWQLVPAVYTRYSLVAAGLYQPKGPDLVNSPFYRSSSRTYPIHESLHSFGNLESLPQGARYRQASALVLSVPKSGRTWFRVMLSKYLSLHFGEELDIGATPNPRQLSRIFSTAMRSGVTG